MTKISIARDCPLRYYHSRRTWSRGGRILLRQQNRGVGSTSNNRGDGIVCVCGVDLLHNATAIPLFLSVDNNVHCVHLYYLIARYCYHIGGFFSCV